MTSGGRWHDGIGLLERAVSLHLCSLYAARRAAGMDPSEARAATKRYLDRLGARLRKAGNDALDAEFREGSASRREATP